MTTQNITKAASKKGTSSKRPRQAAATELTWTATIAHTRHHWWWYPAILWTGLVVGLLLLDASNWSAAILAVLCALALIIINVGKPRIWTVTVKNDTILIERPGYRRFRYQLDLDRYRAFTVVDMPVGKRDLPQRAIALISRRRIAGVRFLVLPGDEITDDMLIHQFSDFLPYDAGTAFTRTDRVIGAIARVLGLT
jgi:hypothetical protein